MTSPTSDLKSTYPPNNALRVGIVDSVVAGGAVAVTVSGKIVPVAFLDPAGYVDGAPVALLRGEASWLALGVPRTYPAQTVFVAATGDIILTGVSQDVIGGTITVTVAESTPYHAIGVFDCQISTAAAMVVQCTLSLDGSALPGQAIFQSVSSVARATATQQWVGTLTAGTHTFTMAAFKSAALGVAVIQDTNTTLTVRLGA